MGKHTPLFSLPFSLTRQAVRQSSSIIINSLSRGLDQSFPRDLAAGLGACSVYVARCSDPTTCGG